MTESGGLIDRNSHRSGALVPSDAELRRLCGKVHEWPPREEESFWESLFLIFRNGKAAPRELAPSTYGGCRDVTGPVPQSLLIRSCANCERLYFQKRIVNNIYTTESIVLVFDIDKF